MKNSIKILMAIAIIFSFSVVNAQIKNTKTETVKVFGNCGMCKKNIEKAGDQKNVANVTWDKDSKIATITFDNKKTSEAEILKRIALAGYDNEAYLAPDGAYAQLDGCCQYDRTSKPTAGDKQLVSPTAEEHNVANVVATPIQAVLNDYFLIKDALVQSDEKAAATNASSLTSAIAKVQMNALASNVHAVWMKVIKPLGTHAAAIAQSKDIKTQRASFAQLSEAMYQLAKAVNPKEVVYYQHCPMYNGGKGANWLSKEEKVKNPFYGSMMLGCGSTVETIK